MSRLIQQAMAWDDRLFAFVFGVRGGRKAGRRLLSLLTHTADGFWYLAAGILWALLEGEGSWPYLAAAAAAFALEVSLYSAIKKRVRRPRPFRRLEGVQFMVAPPDEFSFPSGHTAGAFLMALVLCSAHPILFLPAFTWAALVGLSRVALGVHYPGDVLAGMVLGLSSAALALRVFLP